MSRWTKDRKAEAVGLSEVIGIRPAARKMGVAESTLRGWREEPEFAQLRARLKEEVADDVWAAFQIGITRIVELIPKADDLRSVAIATGIVYDKHALLTGGATNRSESRDISGTLSDAELIEAVREAERLTGEDRTAQAAEGSPAG